VLQKWIKHGQSIFERDFLSGSDKGDHVQKNQVLLYNSEWLQHLCSLHHRIPLLLKDKALKPTLESNS